MLIEGKYTFNVAPLCFLPSGMLVCYRRGNLELLKDGKEVCAYPVFTGWKERWLGRIRPIYRILRMGIRAAIAIDDDHVILSVGNMLYEYCFSQQQLSKGFCLVDRIRPLIFTELKGISGFTDGVVFGEYFGNTEKRAVKIYRRTGVDQWEVVGEFPAGSITHVHNLVADAYRNSVWAFTGDFGEESAIWKITDDFKHIERVLYGDQKYRGCVAFALPEGVLYATDAPFQDDFIYLMKDDLALEEIAPIDGSCIYGCQWRDEFVFQSTVEPNGLNQTRWQLYTQRKRGDGIKNDYAHIYVGNLQKGFREIYKEKKDWLPMIFQFGVFKFPAGVNNSDTLYFQPVATNKNDGRLMRIKT